MNRDEVLARAMAFVEGCGVPGSLRSSTVMEVASEVMAALRSADEALDEPLDEREFASYLRSQLLWWRLQDASA